MASTPRPLRIPDILTNSEEPEHHERPFENTGRPRDGGSKSPPSSGTDCPEGGPRRDHRPGLRRPARWPGPSPTGGSPVLGFDIDADQGRQAPAGARATSATSPTTSIARDDGGAASRRPTDFDRLGEPDAIIICVPTPLTEAREPDLDLRRRLGPRRSPRRLRPGQLVVLESTTYPGTTRDVVLPILEAGGLKAGRDFFLAFSPEREDPGNPNFSAPTIPKVVGGLDPASLELAVGALRPGRRPGRAGLQPRGRRGVQDPREHLSGREHRPGQRAEGALRPDGDRRLGGDRGGEDQAVRLPGVLPGPRPGRALHPDRPVLPDLGRPQARAARPGSSSWPARSTRRCPPTSSRRVADALNDRGKPVKGSQIPLLGMAYKKDVDDPRESPGFELMDLLLEKGAEVDYNDPHIPDPARDAALPAPADGEPGADARVPRPRRTAC